MNSFTFGVYVGALTVGVICGIFPLGIAAVKNRPMIGFAFFALCVAAGFVGGLLLGVPTSVVLCAVANMLPHKRFRPEDLYR
ncbi:MAG: hypothetical protein L0Y71_22525 [Gemmataceae bacterium]|nr:hypothetical protein [Gemmataceae bacterium]